MSRILGRLGGAVAAAVALSTLGCSSGEERVDAALARFEQAIAANDAPAASIAVEDIAEALPDSSESAYKVAHLWVRADDYGRALWLLEDAVERFPEAHDLSITLAEVATVLGNPARALLALDRIPDDAPQAQAAELLRARVQRDLGDGAGSLATLAAAEERFEDWGDFRGVRIEFLVSDQRFDDALELIREARGREGVDAEKQAWFAESEASLLAREGRVDEALAILTELTETGPENQRAWARRAQLLSEQRRFDESCEWLRAALERRPDLAFLYELLAAAENGRGNSAETEALYRERVEVVGDVAGVERLALFLLANGRPDEAVGVLAAKRGAFDAAEATELEYLEIAILLDQEKFEIARTRFAEYRRRHPGDPRVEYLRARFELFDGDASASAARLQQLLPRFDRSDVQHWYGRALEARGDFDGAENHYGLAVMRNPNQIASHRALLTLLERRGAWGEVRSAAERLLRVNPGSEAAALALSRALVRGGTPEVAEQFLRAFIRVHPNLGEPMVGLASALRAQGRVSDALGTLDQSEEAFGSKVSWRSERALALMELGRPEEALAVLDRPDPDGSPAALQRIRALVLFSSERGAEGVAAAEHAFELDPTQPAPLRWVGDHYAKQRDSDAAIAAYRRYLALHPQDAEALFRLGAALDRTGDRSAAIAAYRRSMTADPHLIPPRNNLALALDAADHGAEALAIAQEAYARDSENPMVLDTLGWLWVGAERGERGVVLLGRAHELLPEDPLVAYHLAVGLGRTGRSDESRAMLQQLEERLAPDDALRAPVVDAIAELEAKHAS